MLRDFLNKNQARYETLPTDGSISNTKLFVKAFGHGALEGAAEGLVIVGAVSVIVTTVVAIKNLISK